MSNNIVEQAKVAVILDGRDAETVLKELTSNVNKYTDALTKAYQAGDKKAMKEAITDLKNAETQLNTFKKQTFEVSKVLDNLSGSSIKDLRKALIQLQTDFKNAVPGEVRNQIKSNIESIKNEIKKAEGVSVETGFSFKRMWEFAGGMGTVELAKEGLKLLKEGFMKVIESTKGTADRFKFSMSGVNEVSNTFFRTIAQGKNPFSNFVDDMGKAYERGKKLAEVIDSVNENMLGLGIQGSKIHKENIDDYEILHNGQVGLNKQIEAGQRILERSAGLEKDKTVESKRLLDIRMKSMKDESKLSEDQIEQIIVYRNKYQGLIDQADDYNEKIKERDNLERGMLRRAGQGARQDELNEYRKSIDEIDAYFKTVPAAVKNMYIVNKAYGDASEETITKLAEAWNNYYEQQSSFKTENKRITTSVNSLIVQSNKEMLDNELKDNETYLKNKTIQTKKDYINGIINEETYNNKLNELNNKKLNKDIEIYNKHKDKFKNDEKEISTIENKIADARETILNNQILLKEKNKKIDTDQIKSDIANAEAEDWINQQMILQTNELYDKKQNDLTEALSNNLKTQEDYNKESLKLEEDRLNDLNNLGLTKDKSLAIAKLIANKKLLIAKDIVKKEINLEKAKNDQMHELRLKNLDNASTAIDILTTLVSKESDIGKILLAASKIVAIARIWVENTKSNAISYATALAEFAELGPAAPAAAAAWVAPIVAANNTSAALNTGLIIAQGIKEIGGFSKGGYTGDGNRQNIAGPVHYDEYVISSPVLHNPYVQMNMIPILESLHQNKRGFASGGFTSTTTTPTDPFQGMVDPQQSAINSQILLLLQHLADNGIYAETNINDKHIREIDKRRARISTIQSKANKYG